MNEESPVLQIHNKMKRYSFVLPLSVTLAVLSILPLSYGIGEGNLLITLFFGSLFIGSILALILWAIWDNRLRNEMFEASEQELSEISEGLDLLHTPSPSNRLH